MLELNEAGQGRFRHGAQSIWQAPKGRNSLMRLTDMFPDEDAATAWFENIFWPGGRFCPRCGCADTERASATSSLPWYCRGCRKPFSVLIGTALERSKVLMRKWLFAIHLEMTSLEGVSSIKPYRDLKVTRKMAWFMLHRIREAWKIERAESMRDVVEADETYLGGRKRDRHSKKKSRARHGLVGKSVVVGPKDRDTNEVRAEVVDRRDARTLQGFAEKHTDEGARVHIDEARAYVGMKCTHESVKRSSGEYVRSMIHTQGMAKFPGDPETHPQGVYHEMSKKHLHRYVRQFAGKHDVCKFDALDKISFVVAGMLGKRLMHNDLIS